LMALGSNVYKILQYLNGRPGMALDTGAILFYTIAMVFLCFSLAWYYRHQNKKLPNPSTILSVESTGAGMDGIISLGVGSALLGIRWISIDGPLGFTHYIGDALLVVVLVFLFGKGPFVIVRKAFIELAGGVLQDADQKEQIEAVVKSHFGLADLLGGIYVTKTGSNYLVVVYIENTHTVECRKIRTLRNDILEILRKDYEHIMLEVALR
ncbi:MAG: cation transporter, partial [Spirochaetota bacterium]